MSAIPWILGALAVAFAALFIFVRMAHRRLPPLVLEPGEAMPTTPHQRLAGWTLAGVILLTLAAGAFVVRFGVDVWWNDDAIRLGATGCLLAALAVFTFYITRVRIWRIADTMDERDQAILRTAPVGQAPAMMVVLAAWMIALTEAYADTHLVPSAFLYLIFWSCLMTSVIAQLTGVLVGYTRS
jgi:hypothetical protein